MENKRAMLISAICFLISMILIGAYGKVRRSEMTREWGEEVDIVVAAKPIAEYQLIREDMVTTTRVFKAFRQPQGVSDVADVIGKSAFVGIYQGEQIVLTKLVTQDGRPVLDRQIEKKMRAITVPVAPHTGVSKLIRPGNRIDILAVPNYEYDGQVVYEVKTLLQNVLVLATGKSIQNSVPTRINREVMAFLEDKFDERRRKDFAGASVEGLPTTRPTDDYGFVTLQLSPEDAEKMLFLETTFGAARIYYTLRNSSDTNADRIETTILDDILGTESDFALTRRRPPPPQPPRPPRFEDVSGGRPVPVQ